jgi:glycosyltransferase involved in cell wall biosynthesis
MRILVFTETMGIGGTEKAACRWAAGLVRRGHTVAAAAFDDGPRSATLPAAGVAFQVCPRDAGAIATLLRTFQPDVIHAHMPGFPSTINLLFEAIPKLARRIPVVQTNIFGRLDNPSENPFVDFRLFICWSSCVQAAQRAFHPLNQSFFQRASVAVNPMDPDDGPPDSSIRAFRDELGVKPGEVVLGQLCRPDPVRWSELPVQAFRAAQQRLGNLRFLIREAPPAAVQSLQRTPDADRFIFLPVTSDPEELRLTTAALDIVLHYSKIGESFGYGVAEPMNLGRPAIVNHAPWLNLGQIELARHQECGFAVTSVADMAEAIVKLGADPDLRRRFGSLAQKHVRALTDPESSLDRLEMAFQCAVSGKSNPEALADVQRANEMASYLRKLRFGQSWRDSVALMPHYYRVRFHQWRQVLRRRIFAIHLL